HTTHVMLAAVPGALVHWLFLTPPDILQIGIWRQSVTQLLFRERIKLLKTNKRNIVLVARSTLFEQVIVHLATAQDDALNFRRIHTIICNHILELTIGQFFK